MKVFHSIQIERYIEQLMLNDIEMVRIIGSFEMEKDEVIKIMVEHFRDLGIFMVEPSGQDRLIRNHLLEALVHSPALRQRRLDIQKKIEKARARSRREV